MQLLQALLGSIRHDRNDSVSLASQIRRDIVTMVTTAKSGHPGGALGLADIFAVLYAKVLTHRPTQPAWEKRDRLLLSNGHTCPVLYATLARTGYFDPKLLATLRSLGSPLQGHPHRESLVGVENTSGPLGLGLSQAIGCALALSLNASPAKVFCVLSDGEQQEGQTWEAYMYAGVKKLGNLAVIIDRNNIQIGGFTKEILEIEPFAAKLTAFGWKAVELDGHNHEQLHAAFSEFKQQEQQQPVAYICSTTPGKGVSFMENLPEWHGKPLNQEQLQQALKELA